MDPTETTDHTPTVGFRVLQFAVFGMGVLLILGFVGLIAAAVLKSNADKDKPQDATSAAITPTSRHAFTPFDEASIALPDGAKLVSFSIDGNVLGAHVRGEDAKESIIFIDIETRQRLGTLALK